MSAFFFHFFQWKQNQLGPSRTIPKTFELKAKRSSCVNFVIYQSSSKRRRGKTGGARVRVARAWWLSGPVCVLPGFTGAELWGWRWPPQQRPSRQTQTGPGDNRRPHSVSQKHQEAKPSVRFFLWEGLKSEVEITKTSWHEIELKFNCQ